MLKFKHKDKTVVWLDHQELINNAYTSQAAPSSSNVFRLKSALFDFKPKENNKSMSTPVQSKSKERKKRSLKTNYSNEKEHEEHLILKYLCDGFLENLSTKVVFNNSKNVNNEDLKRFWEENHEFPKMNGANETLEFHHFSNNEFKYIIPPHCRFFNHDVLCLNEIDKHFESYDFIVIDPPWRNKYIRRVKRFKRELGYHMVQNTSLQQIQIDKFIHKNSLIAIWCTNSELNKEDLVHKILPAWNLRLLKSIIWFKVNSAGKLIGDINPLGGKQPYEMLYIASHKDSERDFSKIKELDFLVSIPSIVHSHKPPILELFREFLPLKPKCLELFARYLHPEFTSIGLEVLKLMDERLYQKC